MFASETNLFERENPNRALKSNAKICRALSNRQNYAAQICIAGMQKWNIGCKGNQSALMR